MRLKIAKIRYLQKLHTTYNIQHTIRKHTIRKTLYLPVIRAPHIDQSARLAARILNLRIPCWAICYTDNSPPPTWTTLVIHTDNWLLRTLYTNSLSLQLIRIDHFTLSILSTDVRTTRSGRRSTAEIRPYGRQMGPPSINFCEAHVFWIFIASTEYPSPFPTHWRVPPPVGTCRNSVSP